MGQIIDRSISIVMPVFNEERIISKVVTSFIPILACFKQAQFVLINDASTDSTMKILNNLCDEYPYIKIINNIKNCGHGMSIVNAYKHITGDYVFQCDSDNQFFADDFWLLWKEMEKNNRDLVIGYRKERDDPLIRLIITRALRVFLFIFFGYDFIDCNSPFRLYRRNALVKLTPSLPSYSMIPSILMTIVAASKKMNIGWVHVRHMSRKSDKSLLKNWKILRLCIPALREVFSLWRI